MWFINDVTIKRFEYNEAEIILICKNNNIKVGNGWYKRKWLGRIISDINYPKLIELLMQN